MSEQKQHYDPGETKILWRDGQPCKHKGCLNHLSHPCEGCGRINAQGIVCEAKYNPLR